MVLAVDSVHKLNCIHKDLNSKGNCLEKYCNNLDDSIMTISTINNINSNKNANINILKINIKSKNNLIKLSKKKD